MNLTELKRKYPDAALVEVPLNTHIPVEMQLERIASQHKPVPGKILTHTVDLENGRLEVILSCIAGYKAQKYFIEITNYTERNNLERELQQAYQHLQYVTIPRFMIDTEIENRYANTIDRYRSNKGKGHAMLDRNNLDDCIIYTIGKSIVIKLIEIKNEL